MPIYHAPRLYSTVRSFQEQQPTKSVHRVSHSKKLDFSELTNSIEMAKVIKCNICGVTFPTFEAAWDHYIEVHVKKNFICSMCLEEFGDMHSFVSHWINIHRNANNMKSYTRFVEMVSYKCRCHVQSGIFIIIFVVYFISPESQCGPSNKCSPKLFTEITADIPVKLERSADSTCRSESSSSKNSTQLLSEAVKKALTSLRKSRGKKPMSEYENFMEYYNHIKVGFCCKICRKRYLSRQTLINHLQIVHGRRRFPNIPSYTPRIHSFQRKLISKFKGITCSICDGKFHFQQQLKMHILEEHGIEIHCCFYPRCTESFAFKSYLEKHLKSHEIVCILCILIILSNFAAVCIN